MFRYENGVIIYVPRADLRHFVMKEKKNRSCELKGTMQAYSSTQASSHKEDPVPLRV